MSYSSQPGLMGGIGSTILPLAMSRARYTTKVQYRPRYFVTQDEIGDGREWRRWDARRSRYTIQWAHYENTIYNDVNTWAETLKQDESLYEYIRSIYSPAHRLGEFWATHVYGGQLDPKAGPGDTVASGIPIITENDAIRPAIARVWQMSDWQTHKETTARFGGVMGDVYLTIDDDPGRQFVRIRVIDPRTIYDVEKDRMGNVRGYILVEARPDPRVVDAVEIGAYCNYKEICRRRGDSVIYETYLNDEPFDWNDRNRTGTMPRGAIWMEDYGFVPMVHIQHKDIGLGYGWGELFSLLPKLYELDDQASKLGDYIRKSVDSPWLFCGIDGRDVSEGENTTRQQAGDTPNEGRQRIPIIYAADPNAKAQPLIAPLSLEAVLLHIQGIMRVIEQEHPELTADLALVSGDASGRALRVAREKAEALVTQRRAVYDDAIRKIHQMAISIAAQKGYEGFEAFTENSYKLGELDHSIGPRPVFALNEWDRLELELERAKLVQTFCLAGMPIETAMLRAGYTAEQVAAMKVARDEEAEYRLRQIQLHQVMAASDGASYGQTGGIHQ